jgi:hypothetical protein
MLMTGSGTFDAQRAFTRVARARRRAVWARRLRRKPQDGARLPVFGEGPRQGGLARPGTRQGGLARPGRGVREIPLDTIRGTLEPGRARLFDCCFRPGEPARARWERVWLAEQRGAVLPPISLVDVGGCYAVRDGHHRVSVAIARGALTIDATVDALL